MQLLFLLLLRQPTPLSPSSSAVSRANDVVLAANTTVLIPSRLPPGMGTAAVNVNGAGGGGAP